MIGRYGDNAHDRHISSQWDQDYCHGSDDLETKCQCGAAIHDDEPICFFCGWNHIEKRFEPGGAA